MSRPWTQVLGDRERLVEQFYRTVRQNRSRRALLMIDVYNRAFGPTRMPLEEAVKVEPSSCGEAGWDALPALENYLALARRNGIPVIHTVSDESAPQSVTATLRFSRVHEQRDSLPAPWGNTIVEPLIPRDDELVITKSRASAFYGTAILAHLRRLGVDSLVVVGESTSGCVRASAVDAYSHGFDVAIAEDGVFDRCPLSHAVSLFDLNCKYATVTTAAATETLLSTSDDLLLTPDGTISAVPE